MQSLAAEMNYSETTFVLPPSDPSNTARVRIFNRTSEMPFAGHPNVGTGCVLAAQGRASGDVLRFEEIAGLVEVRVTRDARGGIAGTHIAAPQPLSTGPDLPVDGVAACAGLSAHDLVLHAHPPRIASVGLPFCFVEVTSDALTRAAPDLGAFRRLAQGLDQPPDRLSLHLYARTDAKTHDRLRARMFAPLSGTVEDPATGSANAALAAFLLSLGGAAEGQFEIAQGVEMGRPSLLIASARRGADGIRATVGGGCVDVLRGEAVLD
ncbi:MAG: PhzF family phenazine biosynthesis protein, partial [Gemmatimonadota bacterium]